MNNINLKYIENIKICEISKDCTLDKNVIAVNDTLTKINRTHVMIITMISGKEHRYYYKSEESAKEESDKLKNKTGIDNWY